MKMPIEELDPFLFAPCGMNCMVCYRHCYHKRPCQGCLPGDSGKPQHCRSCKIKDCIQEKGCSYCYECGDYPCKLIRNLERSYRNRYGASLMENSEFVMKQGIEAFMKIQKQRYTYPTCGGIISLHDFECSECQEKMKEDVL